MNGCIFVFRRTSDKETNEDRISVCDSSLTSALAKVNARIVRGELLAESQGVRLRLKTGMVTPECLVDVFDAVTKLPIDIQPFLQAVAA
jgi:hypothetical protein